MTKNVTPLKQIKQEVLDYLPVEQVLINTPIIILVLLVLLMLALSVLLMLTLSALNLRSRLILVLTLVLTAAAIWVSVEIVNEIISLSEFNQSISIRYYDDTIEDTIEDVSDWYFLQTHNLHGLCSL